MRSTSETWEFEAGISLRLRRHKWVHIGIKSPPIEVCAAYLDDVAELMRGPR